MIEYNFSSSGVKFPIPSKYYQFYNITDQNQFNFTKLPPFYRKLLLLVDDELAIWDEKDQSVFCIMIIFMNLQMKKKKL